MPICPYGYDSDNALCDENIVCCVKNENDGCNEDCAKKICDRADGKWVNKTRENSAHVCQIGMLMQLNFQIIVISLQNTVNI